MAISANISGEVVLFENFIFNKTSLAFESRPNTGAEPRILVGAPFELDDCFDNKDFLVFFFSKAGLTESEIFQVYDKPQGNRMGWLIPVNALSSNDHDKASDIHFQKYAYAAIKFSLKGMSPDIFTKTPQDVYDRSFFMSDFLPESTAILVVSKEKVGDKFEISRWTPSFAACGYFPLTPIDPKNIKAQSPRNHAEKFYVYPVSESIDNIVQISAIISYTFPYEGNPLFQFFYLYQIIEFLLDLVFRNEQSRVVQDLINSQNDLNATKEILERTNQNTSERKRLNLLISNYCRCETETTELVRLCNFLLPLLKQKQAENFTDAVYPIRNFLFHQYRNFPRDGEEILSSINSELVALLPKLLSKFSHPC